jgi:chemosensory pili system protein ChpA (sensor histidine kinase/response regulator)
LADTTLLSWISTEVDQALNLVRDKIAKYSEARADEALLRVCPEHLHQVSGALRMVGLAGATRFCEALEGSFAGVNGSDSGKALGVIDRAVLALKEFVDDLAHGKANVPLRLFPAYRDLSALQGKQDSSEKDLFFPELAVAVPANPAAKPLPKDELGPYLLAQRTRFQRGVLGWLRNQPSGLEDMRAALEGVDAVAAQLPEPRGLWWAAVGLVDALMSSPEADWAQQCKPICNKLDFQMRDFAGGGTKGNEALLREVLYMLAKCKPATERIQSVKQLYKLESLFPSAEVAGGMEFNMDWLQPALADVRSRLEALKSIWLQYVSGEPKSAARFRDQVASFKAKAVELGNPQLVKLLDAIALVCGKLPDPHPQQSQLLVIEMASAFLLVESVIEHFTAPAEDLEQQIGIMGGWLLDASTGKSSGQPPAGLRADLSRQIGAMQLRAQVAKEILANLQHVEQVLDAFARDAGKRDTLAGLAPYLRQIHGALTVLGLERAAEVLSICETLVGTLASSDQAAAAHDLDWIAEGLSSLGFYLEPSLRGGEPAGQAITLFFRRYEQRSGSAPAAAPQGGEAVVPDLVLDDEPSQPIEVAAEAPQAGAGLDLASTIAAAAAVEFEKTVKVPAFDPDATVIIQPAPAAAPAPAAEAERPPVNQELLEIYLDEAGEVLATINGSLPECRSQPQNRDALTTIRRGFHTLKGSGRMVGLMDLGEVAWEIEQVMNRWLEQQRPATPTLLELIEMATAAFSEWVTQLRSGSLKGEIDAAAIVELARKLKSGEITTPPAEPPAEEVVVGDVRLGRSMFDIYLQEAQGHVASLQDQLVVWRSAPGGDVPHEFLRAAHTLASSSRTAGFGEIADLAGALEQWIPFAQKPLDPNDAENVQAAVERLRDMIGAVGERRAPGSGKDMTQTLHTLTMRQQAAAPPLPVVPPPPPVTIAMPVVEPLAITTTLDFANAANAAKAEEPKPAAVVPAAVPAAPPAAPPSGKELRKMHDDIDEQLLPIFLEEANELLPQIGSDIRDWKANSGDLNVVQSLQRGLHTLKGSARMAGAIRLGELTHIMESRIEAALEAGAFPAELFADLEDKMDRLSLDLERMQAPSAPAPQPFIEEKPLEKVEAKAEAKIEEAAKTPAAPRPAPAAPRAEAPLPSPAAMLRVNADTLDHLINEAGEVSIARSRIEAELRTIKQSLGDLNESISRLRGQLREIEVQADSQMQSRKSELEERNREFDPLEFDRYTRLQELTRLMAESLHDATSIQQGLLKNLGETEAALLAQARTSRDVQQELMRMRAVPFSNLNERLYRVVRQTAREVEKKAELEIEGAQVELDRSVLEKIGAPLEHMLRNSLAHGIESPEARLEADKPESGRISITLRQESNEIALIVSDDGAGLDLDRLHRKAVERGLVGAEQPLSDPEKMQLIFASGLSTAEQVTELAGRGVGMDVVRNEITSIGGRVDISSVRGKGTTFTIYLPLTLAVTQVVMVKAGAATLAISAAMVENVLRLKADAMSSLYDRRMIDLQDRHYPLHYMQQLLGVGGATQVQPYNSVLLLRSGIQRIALHVDELIGNQEIVVKNLGPQLARVPGVAGATVLPDGGIVLIVNPVQLAQQAKQAAIARAAAPTAAAVAEAEARSSAPVVMVVDDSLTVRKITSRLLEREGYQVLTAKDGVDALQQLKDTIPGVMLVDIEMPRMDGFDLTKNVRADPRTARIPIIMISSRTADKHRNQAAQLGVNAFLGKPYQETELLQHISGFVGPISPADITSRLH